MSGMMIAIIALIIVTVLYYYKSVNTSRDIVKKHDVDNSDKDEDS